MLNYLQYIFKEEKNTLISKFLYAQCANPILKKWVSSITSVMNKMDLKFTFEEIETL